MCQCPTTHTSPGATWKLSVKHPWALIIIQSLCVSILTVNQADIYIKAGSKIGTSKHIYLLSGSAQGGGRQPGMVFKAWTWKSHCRG